MANSADERAFRRRTWINLGYFVVGIVLFLAAGFDGKFLGVGLMLYAALGHAVDSLAASVLEAVNSIEAQLAKIESALKQKSN